MDKEKNYEELKKAINEVLGLGEAIGEITFMRILEAMPEDHSYDVYGFTGQEQEKITPSGRSIGVKEIGRQEKCVG